MMFAKQLQAMMRTSVISFLLATAAGLPAEATDAEFPPPGLRGPEASDAGHTRDLEASTNEGYAPLGLAGLDELSLSMPVKVGANKYSKTAKTGANGYNQYAGRPSGGARPPAGRPGRPIGGANQFVAPGFQPAGRPTGGIGYNEYAGFQPAGRPSGGARRSCGGVCLNRVGAADCPRDIMGNQQRLPGCYAETVAVGGYCDASGECGTMSGGDQGNGNCNTAAVQPDEVNSNVYRRVNCLLGGSDNNGPGMGNGECSDNCFTPSRRCVPRPELLPSCSNPGAPNPVMIGRLCQGNGECGTNPNLNNCGAFDVYTRVVCFPLNQP